MREHECRGKEKKTGKWIEGQRCTNGREVWIVYDEDFCKSTSCGEDILMAWRFEEVIPETVGEYTGLKDKYGTKIFEGDILKPKQMNLHGLQAVCWGDFAAGFMFTKPGSKIGESRITEIAVEYCVVVGNIHDNPELLGADNASH